MTSTKRLTWGALILLVVIPAAEAGGQATAVITAAQSPRPTSRFNLGQQRQRRSRIPKKYDMSRIGSRHVEHGMNLYSPHAERVMGEKMAAAIEASSELITDSRITEYVNQLVQSIAAHSDAAFSPTVRIINDVDPNAYSLPGGFLYVNTGLILAAENESQLASAVAHEIAHFAARHTTKLITKQKTWRTISLAGGPVGYLFMQSGLPLLLFKSMRHAELEADLLGIQYLYASGYEPEEFIRLLASVTENEEEETSFWDKAGDTHPLTRIRIDHARSSISRYLPLHRESVVDKSEFQDMKVRVANLMGLKDFGWTQVSSSQFDVEQFPPLMVVH